MSNLDPFTFPTSREHPMPKEWYIPLANSVLAEMRPMIEERFQTTDAEWVLVGGPDKAIIAEGTMDVDPTDQDIVEFEDLIGHKVFYFNKY